MPDNSLQGWLAASRHLSKPDATTSRRGFLTRATRDILGVAAFSGLFALPGCGGGRSVASKGTGSLSLTIKWPTTTTRFIPTLANSIVITVTNADSDATLKTMTVTRSQTSVTATGIPAGSAYVKAKAYASTDGSGTALATGSSTAVTVVSGQTTAVQTLTLGSTVKNIAIIANEDAARLGRTITIAAVAKDTDGNIVLVAPTAWTWSCKETSVVKVTGSGTDNTATLACLGDGVATVYAYDKENSASTMAGSRMFSIKEAANLYVGWVNRDDSNSKLYMATLTGAAYGTVTMLNHFNTMWSGDGCHYLWTSPYSAGGLWGKTSLKFASTDTSMRWSHYAKQIVSADQSDTSIVKTAGIGWTSDLSPSCGTVSQVSPAGMTCQNPAISANGGKIAYQGRYDSGDDWTLYTVNADGSNFAAVDATYTPHASFSPALSGDGSWVAFALNDRSNIACVSTIGDKSYKWAGLPQTSTGLQFVDNADRVYWNTSGASEYESYVYFCDATGQNKTDIANVGNRWWYAASANSYSKHLPTVSPDGKYLVYSWRRDSSDSGIRLVNLETEAVTNITTNENDCNPIFVEW